MTKYITYTSVFAIPIMITIILVHGYVKGVSMYDAFVEGAAEGFKTAIRIMPYLIAIFIAIGLMRGSGAIYYLVRGLRPITSLLGIPGEILPLALMKPISGSGSLAVLQDILVHNGPDSFVGRVASTMMGSSETIFYTMAVYYGTIGIKKSRHTIPSALVAHLAAILAAVFFCKILLSQ
ncbi:spore maturation protein [Serpentinicella alkaliphila]|uniref:Spore maturation protein B n=1 Tax=Serpentinicella alkaliphila TaxID=1734049 RepID=A0A4R2TEI9_9FIRM|nr:nucleoside recognition domain-containing protein [Serpentinicella alkaliphila]QUH25103.1 spore maturation protein [Serpentinicella alkaliphila]TCQ01748.1 spore maturation protein B [Serpentinicella alkaliphila]